MNNNKLKFMNKYYGNLNLNQLDDWKDNTFKNPHANFLPSSEFDGRTHTNMPQKTHNVPIKIKLKLHTQENYTYIRYHTGRLIKNKIGVAFYPEKMEIQDKIDEIYFNRYGGPDSEIKYMEDKDQIGTINKHVIIALCNIIIRSVETQKTYHQQRKNLAFMSNPISSRVGDKPTKKEYDRMLPGIYSTGNKQDDIDIALGNKTLEIPVYIYNEDKFGW